MGAFETFVNANLGIRKPLILDLGHPSGSSKAAGVVGSQYIDSDNNFLYEKTGENNSEDWSFVRRLGEAASSSLGSELGALSGELVSQIQNSSGVLSSKIISSSGVLSSEVESVSENLFLTGQSVEEAILLTGQSSAAFTAYEVSALSDNVFLTGQSLEQVILATGQSSASFTESQISTLSESLSSTGENLSKTIVQVENKISNVSSSTFSTSEALESGISNVYFTYTGIGASGYSITPQVVVSLRSPSLPSFIYAYSTHSVDSEGFNVAFSDDITDSNLVLDILVNGAPASATSVQWFESSGDYLVAREEAFTGSSPAVHLWETGANNTIIPRESGYSSLSESSQYFEETGEYITIT